MLGGSAELLKENNDLIGVGPSQITVIKGTGSGLQTCKQV
jgi:hypothetical protein